MKVDKFMPLYIGEYLQHTQHLNTEQHGAYLMLIMHAWTSGDGSLPNDDIQLAVIARLSISAWRKHRDVIMPLLLVEGDRLVSKRARKEIERAKGVSERRRDAQTKSVQSRAQNDSKTDCKPIAKRAQNDSKTVANAIAKRAQNDGTCVYSVPCPVGKATTDQDRYEEASEGPFTLGLLQ